MTEDEAKKLWCPQARIGVTNLEGGGFSVNRSGPSVPLRNLDRCLGSACMAWRWQSKPYPNAQTGETGSATGDGHCGLAGKP